MIKSSLIFRRFPPYRLLDERDPLKVVKKREILEPGGKVILRHYYKSQFSPKYFELKKQTTIGDDTLSFFE